MNFDKDDIKQATTEVVSTIFDPYTGQNDGTKLALRTRTKGHFCLWLSIVVGIIISGSLVSCYFIISNSNDKIAKEYKTSLVSYLSDIYDTANSSTDSPSEVSRQINNIQSPLLAKVYIDNFSKDYDNAQKLDVDSSNQIKTLKSKIADCSTVYDFYNQWRYIESQLSQISNTTKPDISTYEDFRDTLAQFMALQDNTAFPQDLLSYQDNLRNTTKNLQDAWQDLLDAYGVKNQAEYNTAYNNYKDTSKTVEAAIEPYKIYYDNLSSKVKLAATDVKLYVESIK